MVASLATLLAFNGASAQNAATDAQADEILEEIIVTGSRIANAKPTAQVVTIDSEEIARRGLATGDEIIRSLPQNFSNINLGSSAMDGGRVGTAAMGTATANLRGIGEGGTLVLVNGRRVAGSAMYDGGEVNLSTIPAAAIDRVEILLDGASAIYGADGVAGVINFILKDDYQGATTKARFEDNANGGGSLGISQTFGTNWSSGNLMLAVDYRETEAVDTRRAGWTTQDLTSRGGADWRNGGNFGPGSPGVIAFMGALPSSFDGTEAWTAADLIPIAQLTPYDAAGNSNGTPETEALSATLGLRQSIGDSFTLFADLLYSQNDNTTSIGEITGGFISVPDTNPFNQIGTPVTLGYLIEDVNQLRRTDIERTNFTLGADIDLPAENWALTLSGTVGEETTDVEDFTYDFNAAAATENLFGNGSALDISPFLVNDPGDSPGRETEAYEAIVNGTLGSLSGGDIGLAVGLHARTETLDYSNSPDRISLVNPIDDKLDLDNQAYFFELNFPFVGASNSRAGIQEFIVNVAGRYEDYDMKGKFGGADSSTETKSFDNFSPRIGASLAFNDAFRIRSSWGESFKAPNLRDLGSQMEYLTFFTFDITDPRTGQPATVFWGRGGNPDLEPETAETFSFGFEWTPGFAEGLTVSATYTDIDWEDNIQTIRALDPAAAAIPELLEQLIHYDVPVEQGGDGDPNTPDAWPTQPLNVASRSLRNVDLDISYLFSTDAGDFDLGLTAIYALDVHDQLLPGSDEIQRDETDEGPDRLVTQGRFGWSNENFAANLFVKYSSGYDNTQFGAVQTRVDSYTTADLTGSYTMDNGFRVNAGVFNLTDASFPFYDTRTASFDTRRVDTRGRWFFLELSKEFTF